LNRPRFPRLECVVMKLHRFKRPLSRFEEIARIFQESKGGKNDEDGCDETHYSRYSCCRSLVGHRVRRRLELEPDRGRTQDSSERKYELQDVSISLAQRAV
jgi:hypothetical protein